VQGPDQDLPAGADLVDVEIAEELASLGPQRGLDEAVRAHVDPAPPGDLRRGQPLVGIGQEALGVDDLEDAGEGQVGADGGRDLDGQIASVPLAGEPCDRDGEGAEVGGADHDGRPFRRGASGEGSIGRGKGDEREEERAEGHGGFFGSSGV